MCGMGYRSCVVASYICNHHRDAKCLEFFFPLYRNWLEVSKNSANSFLAMASLSGDNRHALACIGGPDVGM